MDEKTASAKGNALNALILEERGHIDNVRFIKEFAKPSATVEDLRKMGFSRKQLGVKGNKYRPSGKRTVPLGFVKTDHRGYIQDSSGTLYYTNHPCGGLISNRPKLTKAEKKKTKREKRSKNGTH